MGRDAQSLALCAVLCRLLFVLLVFVLSVLLQFMVFDYPPLISSKGGLYCDILPNVHSYQYFLFIFESFLIAPQ
jgi:hypothetical protein